MYLNIYKQALVSRAPEFCTKDDGKEENKVNDIKVAFRVLFQTCFGNFSFERPSGRWQSNN